MKFEKVVLVSNIDYRIYAILMQTCYIVNNNVGILWLVPMYHLSALIALPVMGSIYQSR